VRYIQSRPGSQIAKEDGRPVISPAGGESEATIILMATIRERG
jgi:hypothetical protein